MECIKCGEYCRQLCWDEKLKISWHTKRFMFTKICYFLCQSLMNDNLFVCFLQKDKLKVCKDFHCGVQHIKK